MNHARICTAFVLALAGIAQAQEIDRAKLTGTWENTGPGYSQRQTFRDDGTFEVIIRSDVQMMNREESGRWELKGSTLSLTVDKSSTDGRSGKSASFALRRVTADELVIQKSPANPDDTVTFKRVR